MNLIEELKKKAPQAYQRFAEFYLEEKNRQDRASALLKDAMLSAVMLTAFEGTFFIEQFAYFHRFCWIYNQCLEQEVFKQEDVAVRAEVVSILSHDIDDSILIFTSYNYQNAIISCFSKLETALDEIDKSAKYLKDF